MDLPTKQAKLLSIVNGGQGLSCLLVVWPYVLNKHVQAVSGYLLTTHVCA
jgi:hypothetical protein